MFLLNGSPLAVDTPFTANDIQYPANWLRLSSVDEKAAIGITEVPDPEIYDDRFYWGVGIPKDILQVKQAMISQIKATAGSLLSPSDWKIIRQAEGGPQVSQETLSKRQAIREASNTNEEAVNACTTVDELSVLQMVWPDQGA